MEAKFIEYSKVLLRGEELLNESRRHMKFMDSRRSVREFSSEPVSIEVLENLVMTASTAPSGANKQPWTFCIVTNAETRTKIRTEAEKEEYESYHGRMPKEWLDDLSYLGTDWKKPFLENAAALIIVFRKTYDLVDGVKQKNYYPIESIGLACGFLIQAIHQCGQCY